MNKLVLSVFTGLSLVLLASSCYTPDWIVWVGYPSQDMSHPDMTSDLGD